ncbi:MAG: LacI family DNA-binding transcriptional regulator [Selenomonadaceae bacterium]|nr:LacI family DNA-binding transcriptional regulator [Selenomonadaceae bacterium]
MEYNIKTTIVDVAKRAGVSVATVSRVVNDKDFVRDATRRKVLKAINELKYVPNMSARELHTQHSTNVGVVVPSVYNMFFAEVIDGIEDFLRQGSYSLLLNCAQNNPQQEMNCIKAFMSRNVSGVIVISPNTNGINEEFYKEIAKQISLVFINAYYHIPGACYVTNDEAMGTEEALNYLFNLNHKRILFVRGVNSDSYEIKEITYRRIMKSKGIAADDYIINIGEGNGMNTVDDTAKCLAKTLSYTDATAIFCCNDLMGVGAINACKRLGKLIPQDISIIGYDNISISHFIEPKLTTMDQNMFQLGSNAAELLIDNINTNRSKRVTLYNVLVVRYSTGYNNY